MRVFSTGLKIKHSTLKKKINLRIIETGSSSWIYHPSFPLRVGVRNSHRDKSHGGAASARLDPQPHAGAACPSSGGHFKLKPLTLSSKAFQGQALHLDEMKNLTRMETHTGHVPGARRAQLRPPAGAHSLSAEPTPQRPPQPSSVARAGASRKAGFLRFPQSRALADVLARVERQQGHPISHSCNGQSVG